MTDPEIIEGLRFTAEEGVFIDADPASMEQAHRAVLAAISRLSATCGTCRHWNPVRNDFGSHLCGKLITYTRRDLACNQHTPRTEEP